jgi:outer membrane lipoprotein-sorting protein
MGTTRNRLLWALLLAAAFCSPSSCSLSSAGAPGAAPLSAEAEYLRGRESIKYTLKVTNTRTDKLSVPRTEHARFSMDLARR